MRREFVSGVELTQGIARLVDISIGMRREDGTPNMVGHKRRPHLAGRL